MSPAIAALHPDDDRFRSTVPMGRYRFGEGEYRYFAHPWRRRRARVGRVAERREVTEELGVAVSAAHGLGRHIAEAANEPGHLVDAELFMVILSGEPCPAAEIDEIAWVDLAAPGDLELASGPARSWRATSAEPRSATST